MPQAYLGERVPTMVRPDPALRSRMDARAASRGYGKRQMNSYLVDLLGALHPDPDEHPEAAEKAAALVQALLEAAQNMRGTSRAGQEQLDLAPDVEGRAA